MPKSSATPASFDQNNWSQRCQPPVAESPCLEARNRFLVFNCVTIAPRNFSKTPQQIRGEEVPPQKKPSSNTHLQSLSCISGQLRFPVMDRRHELWPRYPCSPPFLGEHATWLLRLSKNLRRTGFGGVLTCSKSDFRRIVVRGGSSRLWIFCLISNPRHYFGGTGSERKTAVAYSSSCHSVSPGFQLSPPLGEHSTQSRCPELEATIAHRSDIHE